MPAKEFVLQFLKKEQIGENIFSFYFKKESFTFLPGQYMRMTLPHQSADDRGTSRYFTISSSPSEKYLVITTKLFQSTFKTTLMNLEEGMPVTMFGPLGNLVLPDDRQGPFVFLSGGMGITPFHSMLKYAADNKMQTPLTLIASSSKGADIIFVDELTDISKKYKNIRVIFLNERISEDVLRENIADLHKPDYYLVGPPEMVEGTKELLESLSISEDKILTESFTGY